MADTGNDTIRMIAPGGVVTTLAGTAGTSGSTDGTGSAALFNGPQGLAVDSTTGNIYVADTGNDTIRQVTSAGVVTTLAGTAGTAGSTDGTGSAASFNKPAGIAVDSTTGNIYVADTGNDTIRMIAPGGVVTTLAGTAGTTGSTDGTGTAALFNGPVGVAEDSATGDALRGGHGQRHDPDPVAADGHGPDGPDRDDRPGGDRDLDRPLARHDLLLPARGDQLRRRGDGQSPDFATAANPPTVTTLAATSVTTTGATLNGTVNPNGSTTAASFQYSTNPAWRRTSRPPSRGRRGRPAAPTAPAPPRCSTARSPWRSTRRRATSTWRITGMTPSA